MPGVQEYYETYWQGSNGLPRTGLYGRLVNLLQEHGPGADCAEIGCGDGRTAGLWLNDNAKSYVGVDVSERAVAQARALGLDARVVADASSTGLPAEGFDLVLCLEVLEHLFDPHRAVAEMYRLLRRGGRLLVTVPNAAYWRTRLDVALLGRWDPRGDALSQAEPWRDPHVRFFTRASLGRLLLKSGFVEVDVGGHWGTLLADLPLLGRYVLRRDPLDLDSLRHASAPYRALERLRPSFFSLRLHAVAKKPGAHRR